MKQATKSRIEIVMAIADDLNLDLTYSEIKKHCKKILNNMNIIGTDESIDFNAEFYYACKEYFNN